VQTDSAAAESVQQTAATDLGAGDNEAPYAARTYAGTVTVRAASPDAAAPQPGHPLTSHATDSANAPTSAAPLDPAQSQPMAEPQATAQLPAPAATAATTPAAPAASTQPATPAAQVAPVLLALGQSADGGQQMTLRLHPAELGMVQVQIDKSSAGVANVAITVEKPETLQAILRDQADLHHALDTAGIPAAGRTVTVTLAPEGSLGGGTSGQGQNPQQNAPQNTATSTGSNNANTGGNQAADGQDTGQGGNRGGSYQTQDGYAAAARRQADASSPQDTATAGTWSRVGVNITA